MHGIATGWRATLVPVGKRGLAQLKRGPISSMTMRPALFEVVLIPQLYNARRFAYDLSASPHLTRIEAACLALPAFAARTPPP